MINEKGQFIAKDLTNKRIGKLTLVKRLDKKSPTNGQFLWLAHCDCGNEIETRPGKNSSCRCLIGAPTHGMCYTRFYGIWESMNGRINATKVTESYKGIKCLWNSFEEFKQDMHDSYLKHVKEFGEKQTQIDRIDFNGHYEKSNCRWATLKEQARNKSNNIFIEFQGKRKTRAEWAEEIGIPYFTLRYRIAKGWPIGKALTTPVKK